MKQTHLKPFGCLVALLLAIVATPRADATFPVESIDCNRFDPEDPNFLGNYFGFGTALSYDDLGGTPLSTGFEGFVATPEQVAAIPDFAEGAELPTGGHTLEDLFPGGVGQPGTLQEGQISQSIAGTGNFSEGFSEFTLSQSKRLSASQDSGDFADLFAEGKAYAPFEVAGGGPGPIDALLTIDLFSSFDFAGGGSLSEFLGAALVDLSDPMNPVFMDGLSGFYFTDQDGLFSDFGLGEEGEQDISDAFFSGPASTEPDSPSLASFFYTIETQLTPGNTYALGLFGDGAVGIDGQSSSWLDSTNTLTATIEVQTPGARLFLPGLVVPEPTTAALAFPGALVLLGRGARHPRHPGAGWSRSRAGVGAA